MENHFRAKLDDLGKLEGWNLPLCALKEIYKSSLVSSWVADDADMLSMLNFITSEVFDIIFEKTSHSKQHINLVSSLPDYIDAWKMLCGPLYFSKFRPVLEIIYVVLRKPE